MDGIRSETLQLLEWPRLAEQLATFAGSDPGRALCRRLPLADRADDARRWLDETAELLALDGLLEGGQIGRAHV